MHQVASISITKNVLTADSVKIADQPTIDYIAAFAPEARADAFVNCVQLGARVATYTNDRLGAVRITEKINDSAESARKLLTGISSSTTRQIDSAMVSVFGKNGSFSVMLNTQLDGLQRELESKLDPEKASSIMGRIRDTIKSDVTASLGAIQKDLDLSNPNSPICKLQSEVNNKLHALDEKVAQLVTQTAVRSAVGAERLRGTQKGTSFEERGSLCVGRVVGTVKMY